MKTTFACLLILIGLIFSYCTQTDKDVRSFTLQGKINGQISGNIILRYVPDVKVIIDTVKIKNGEFVFKGMISEPTRAAIIGDNELNSTELYIEPGGMKVTLTKDKFEEIKMTGSKTQDELNELNKMERPILKRQEIFNKRLSSISDSIKNSDNDVRSKHLENDYQEINKLLWQTREELNATWLSFVLENPKSFVTPYYLNMLQANEAISLDSVKSIFNGLDITIQNSKYAKYIKDDIRKQENTLIGSIAPDFKAIDLNDKTVTLSEFKGRNVVLLDFWASWCVPCRKSIPYLKGLYRKYNSKGLEIIAVSLDMDKKAWIAAVKKDSTCIWHHVPVAEKYGADPDQITKDDIYANYFVQGIPLQILIDKNGKIIGRWERYSIDDQESLDRKLAEILNSENK
jgi:thiol-disulfide isomerase/thioredoxin